MFQSLHHVSATASDLGHCVAPRFPHPTSLPASRTMPRIMPHFPHRALHVTSHIVPRFPHCASPPASRLASLCRASPPCVATAPSCSSSAPASEKTCNCRPLRVQELINVCHHWGPGAGSLRVPCSVVAIVAVVVVVDITAVLSWASRLSSSWSL